MFAQLKCRSISIYGRTKDGRTLVADITTVNVD